VHERDGLVHVRNLQKGDHVAALREAEAGQAHLGHLLVFEHFDCLPVLAACEQVLFIRVPANFRHYQKLATG